MIKTDDLLKLTAAMPMKQIDVGGHAYLQRYYAGTLKTGEDVWIHRFMSADGDRHLHNHPWTGESFLLAGGYREEYSTPDSDGIRQRWPNGCALDHIVSLLAVDAPVWMAERLRRSYSHALITSFTWHRIISIEPETWTLLIVQPGRLPFWYFRDSDTGEMESVVSSPREWWHQYGARDGGPAESKEAE